MNRAKIGIDGLDNMLNGGLIEGRPYLVFGPPGTGKSILAMHFLQQGLKEGEKGLLIAFEDTKEELIDNYKNFGWDLEGIEVVDVSPNEDMFEHGEFFERPEATIGDIMGIKEKLRKAILSTKAKRVVVDPISAYKVALRDPFYIRIEILSLMRTLINKKITALLISIIDDTSSTEEYLARGIIQMHANTVEGTKKRGIEIIKMRGSRIDEQIRPIEITNKGIVVYNEIQYWVKQNND
jgi:KaiC/GvpD/RAD55 family RecA-like ATPase